MVIRMNPIKIVATEETHDIEGIIVKMTPQKMFPNCQKYTRCCEDDILFEFRKFLSTLDKPLHTGFSPSTFIKTDGINTMEEPEEEKGY